MKIEKEQTKIIAKKKTQVQPEPVQEQTETIEQTAPLKTKQAEPTTVEPKTTVKPSKPKPQPKVKVKKERKKFSEVFKTKQDQFTTGIKRQQHSLKKSASNARVRRRTLQLSFILTIVVMFVFVPIYPNAELKVNKLMYLTTDDIKVENPLEQYFSPFQFVRYQYQLKNSSEFIKKSEVTYNLKTMTTNVKIYEYKPLAKDSENNIYFYEDGEVLKKQNINLYAPIITGFDQSKLNKLIVNLDKLDYKVITQIDSIEYVGTEDDPDLLKLGMDGDNTVYINIDQIRKKLPYYNQIKQIIDEKAGGKPGVIHLNIGDYYERK